MRHGLTGPDSLRDLDPNRRHVMQRWPARVFAVPVVVLLLMAGVQTVGASSAHVTTPVLHVPSAGGPGYELQISNNL
jgi:hypothetical protein